MFFTSSRPFNIVQMVTAQRRSKSKCPIFEASLMRNAATGDEKGLFKKKLFGEGRVKKTANFPLLVDKRLTSALL